MKMKQFKLFLFVQGLGVQAIFTQQPLPDTLTTIDLLPATVTAYRLENNDLQTPLPTTLIGAYRLQYGQQSLALQETLSAVPGLFVQNADNFAQDVRVSVRGFGSRAAFGIRGVKLLVDGFPETTPDGQGQVDNLEPADLTSLHVVRGASSGLYGNASGGVLNFTTLNFSEKKYLELNASAGAFGFQKYRLKTEGGVENKFKYQFSSSYTRLNGFREQSAMKNYLLNGGCSLALDSNTHLTFVVNYADSPLAQDAGGINGEQALDNPRSARDRNIQFDAGEELTQARAGILFSQTFRNKGRLTTKAYHSRRRFSNNLPFQAGGIVELQRRFSGGGANYLHDSHIFQLPWQVSIGFDIEYQSDDRSRFDNLDGLKGELGFNQNEGFFSVGIYLVQRIDLSEKVAINGGIRYDFNRLEAKDRFLSDGDESGKQTFQNINPILGITYRLSKVTSWYGSLASGFETPALSELSANPSPGGGFNPVLKPQSSITLETGWKSFSEKNRLKYDLAIFHIRLKDELVPYELSSFPGRTFFRNAASSTRTGLELGTGCYWGKGFYSYVNYTFSLFQFTDYQTTAGNFDDKKLPGIPKHLAYAELRYSKAEGLYGSIVVTYAGSQFADDGNTEKISGYWLGNLRLGYSKQLNKWQLEPFAGINNLFGSTYFSNVRINAVAGRYYEPAAGIHLYGGLKIRV
jgi:iron complex outermembrane receptor protein